MPATYWIDDDFFEDCNTSTEQLGINNIHVRKIELDKLANHFKIELNNIEIKKKKKLFENKE